MLKEHLHDLPVQFYADELHVTMRQLNDACRRAMGNPTSEIIQERVLLEARRLPIYSSLTIMQVAATLGYFDNMYFSRFFKKHIGQTPELFRISQPL